MYDSEGKRFLVNFGLHNTIRHLWQPYFLLASRMDFLTSVIKGNNYSVHSFFEIENMR